MYHRWVCRVLLSVYICVPAVCPVSVCPLYAVCSVCLLCVPYDLGIWFVLCVFSVRCVLFVASALHHSVTQSRTCSAFISHRESLPPMLYATQFSLLFVPFLVPRGRLYSARCISVSSRLWKPRPVCAAFYFPWMCACSVSSVFLACCVFCVLAVCVVRSGYLVRAVCVFCALCAVCGFCCASQCHAVPHLLFLRFTQKPPQRMRIRYLSVSFFVPFLVPRG